MPRRGSEKVRTGCRTCKRVPALIDKLPVSSDSSFGRLRKVKCDEGRPECARCVKARRQCLGYDSAPPGSYSWSQLLHLRQPSITNVDKAELRSLTYFNRQLAPFLAGSHDTTFWVSRVPQILEQEPAAQHAVFAISSLYEDFDQKCAYRANLGAFGGCGWRGSAFALQHYNKAIGRVLANEISNLEILLTVSLLFTCIEFLQGNCPAAIKHCQHGIRVYNSSTSRLSSELSAVFSQLSIFPLFFGSNPSDIPLPRHGTCEIEQSTATISEAREALDSLMARAVRLVRTTDVYRLGTAYLHNPSTKASEQEEQRYINNCLDAWWTAFAGLRRKDWSNSEHASIFRLLEMRWLVSKIWANACLDDKETIYDNYLSSFERIVDIAKQEKAWRDLSSTSPSRFTFEMGFLPLLYIAAIKCRYLHVRLTVLSLMESLSSSRETLWDADIMFATALRIIEVEHGTVLDHQHLVEEAENRFSEVRLPNDEDRVRDCENTDDVAVENDGDGRIILRRKVCMFLPDVGGGFKTLWEYSTSRL